MLIRCASRPLALGARAVSASSSKPCAGAAAVSKREDYYKTLGEHVDESKPPGWDSARPFEEIPGPKPLPIVGNLLRFMPFVGELYKIPILGMFQKFREQYGDVVILKGIPGRSDYVYIYDTKDIENLLRNSGTFPVRRVLDVFVYYRTVARKDIFQGIGGVLTVQGEDWFKIRTVVNPILMQPKTVQQYMSKLDGVAGELAENMRHFSRLNETHQMPDDFVNELYKWALESVGIMALNKHFGCLDLTTPQDSDPKKLVTAVLNMFKHLYLIETSPPLWKFISTPLYKKFVKNLDFITSIIVKTIDEALAEPIDESVPEHQLSVLHRLGRKDKRIAFTMVMDMLIAGLDTTGKTLGAILYFLAKNPDKQAKLREEIIEVLPEKDSVITAEGLGKMPYLKAVIRESNRIAPVAVGTVRTTVKELVLGGYQIPKGTNVTVVSICTSNSSEHFKDPEKYMPERWLRDTNDEYSSKNVHSFASLPFGFGPRMCVGMRFASLELELVLMKIIKNFELSWEHPDMEFASHLLYGINNPLKLTVKELTR
ncbi:probable cytochrome P450 12a5, mitochondrial [Leptinotarsa decemlineata]|uniref:probable cytochrome P450 12a5, mitochondrial n=1 Tax=Leptinotarsa decemlineata TaxID=7539 RepID=UPI003D3059F6